MGPPRDPDPIAPWPEVLSLFGLQPTLRPPVPVPGGWSHSVWKVQTVEGAYVVKEIVDNPAGWWIEQMETAMGIELAAWRSGSIAVAEPIAVAGSSRLLGRLDSGGLRRRYRCHRWVEGRPCLDLPPDIQQSEQVGGIVAALAHLGLHKGTTADQLPWNALDAYDDTVDEAGSKGMDWANALAELRPHVARLRADFVDLAGRAKPMALVHRDLDPKNASVRMDGQVALFDWDYAGPRLLASELLDAALSFAGGPSGAREGCLLATVDAYRDAGGPTVDLSDAATPLVEEGFRWIMFNAWLSLGHRETSPGRRAFAGSVVGDLAPRWLDSANATQNWARRLADLSG